MSSFEPLPLAAVPAASAALQELLVTCGAYAHQQAQSAAFTVFEKGANDYVTTVDRTLDRQLTQGLRRLFPQDAILSEENPTSQAIFQTDPQRLWLIDPIDGTADFIAQHPHYAIMLGCLQHYHAIAGWIYAPAHQALYGGGLDWGLWQAIGTEPLRPLQPMEPVPWDGDLCHLLIGYTDRERYGAAIARHIPNLHFRSLGSFGLKVMAVIQGQAGLYLYLNQRVKVWDTVGPLAIAQAAGLICCDLAGNAIRFDPGAVHPVTLAHRQPILVGWPSYVQALRPKLLQAIQTVAAPDLNGD